MLNIFTQRFINQKKYEQLRQQQVAQLPLLLRALSEHGVTEKSKHPLQFYFYTNSKKKALSLAAELEKLKYSLQPIVKNSKGEFSIKGLSKKINIIQVDLKDWVLRMLKLGYENDCEFDGFEVAVRK